MSDFISLQQWLLRVSPGLLPLTAMAYSMVNSWHCSLMCGPLLVGEPTKPFQRAMKFRVAAYTIAGAGFGWAGHWLSKSLEFQATAAIAFATFAVLTLIFVLPQLFPDLPKLRMQKWRDRLRKLSWPASVRGALFSLFPCHLLAFYYGVAALTRSPMWGAALLFAHAIMTTPALAYVWRSGAVARTPGQTVRWPIRLLLLSLILFNLLYFAGHLIHPPGEVAGRPLFCW